MKTQRWEAVTTEKAPLLFTEIPNIQVAKANSYFLMQMQTQLQCLETDLYLKMTKKGEGHKALSVEMRLLTTIMKKLIIGNKINP